MPKKSLVFSVLTGILLSLPWLINLPGVFLHVAFLPLLLAEHEIFEKKTFYSSRLVFLLASLSFFIWNLLAMWWVSNISLIASLLAISANTMLYAIVFWAFHVVKRMNGKRMGNIAFVIFWLAFEYYCLHAEFAQPWLVLGNGLANLTPVIQWYEFTGTLGGSFWILAVNILVFEIGLQYRTNHTFTLQHKILLPILLLAPVLISILHYSQPQQKGTPCTIVITQPNIDPYTEKFNRASQNDQLAKILELADSLKNFKADYYLAPETSIDNDIWENALMNNFSLFAVRSFIEKHPNSAFVLGAITYREYQPYEKVTVTARIDKKTNKRFDVFNSALQIDETFITPVYHKSKLVLGVEKVPFPGLFRFLNNYLVDLGGTTGSLGVQEKRSVFVNKNKLFKVAPVICFESVYGEFLTGYIKNGANLIFVITNDGWWKNSNGYAQHLQLSKLRAIETRRNIARCGNTGISAFIDTRGKILQATPWWKPTILSGTINTNEQITFYTKNGDYIGRIAVFAATCLLLVSLTHFIKARGKF